MCGELHKKRGEINDVPGCTTYIKICRTDHQNQIHALPFACYDNSLFNHIFQDRISQIEISNMFLK